MAGSTVAGDRRMIHLRAQPLSGDVASIALRRGRNMADRLAGGDAVVVTTAARAEHLAMVNGGGRHRSPRAGSDRMAGIALLAAVDMSGSLAGGNDIVVATDAGADYLGVVHAIDEHRHPALR